MKYKRRSLDKNKTAFYRAHWVLVRTVDTAQNYTFFYIDRFSGELATAGH